MTPGADPHHEPDDGVPWQWPQDGPSMAGGPSMSGGLPMAEPQILTAADLVMVGDQLLQEAIERPDGLRTRPVLRGPLMSAVVFALRAGCSLPEHAAPPAASLQVLRGEVVLVAGAQSWELRAGELLPIPLVRHSVDATTDAICLLTIHR